MTGTQLVLLLHYHQSMTSPSCLIRLRRCQRDSTSSQAFPMQCHLLDVKLADACNLSEMRCTLAGVASLYMRFPAHYETPCCVCNFGSNNMAISTSKLHAFETYQCIVIFDVRLPRFEDSVVMHCSHHIVNIAINPVHEM